MSKRKSVMLGEGDKDALAVASETRLMTVVVSAAEVGAAARFLNSKASRRYPGSGLRGIARSVVLGWIVGRPEPKMAGPHRRE